MADLHRSGDVIGNGTLAHSEEEIRRVSQMKLSQPEQCHRIEPTKCGEFDPVNDSLVTAGRETCARLTTRIIAQLRSV